MVDTTGPWPGARARGLGRGRRVTNADPPRNRRPRSVRSTEGGIEVDMTSQKDSSPPVSWRTVRYETPVHASDGARLGTVREVLGSDSEDIFHGLRVRLDSHGRDVMVPADSV